MTTNLLSFANNDLQGPGLAAAQNLNRCGFTHNITAQSGEEFVVM
jgi:hypothetical protein